MKFSAVPAHLIAALALILSVQPATQARQPPPQSATLRFEVASLRVRGGMDPIGLLAYRVSPGRLSHPCATLRTLLFFAYRLNTSTPMEGFPSWGSVPCGAPGFPVGDTYNFQATMPPDTTDAQMRQMMQTFLAERFKLAYHLDTRTMSGFELVVAPGGFKKPASVDEKRAPGALLCLDNYGRNNCTSFAVQSASMVAIAVSRNIGRPVVDRTGLGEETYRFDLKWRRDDSTDPSLPSLPTALREEFGFELKPYTGPVDVFIIDHVEPPSPN